MAGETGTRKCSRCGKLIDARAFVCIYCGYDIRVGWYLAMAGGILAFFAGAVSFAYWQSAFFLTTSIVAIVGGALAISRRGFPLAVAGGVCAVLTPGFLLGGPALVMILLARKAFRPMSSPRKSQ